MFGSLKDKLKGVLSSFGKKVKDEVEEKPVEEVRAEQMKKRSVETKKKTKKEEKGPKSSKKKKVSTKKL